MDRVSGHSGLRESVELRQMAEKVEKMAVKRKAQVKKICDVLDAMPGRERTAMLAEIIRRYKGRD